MSDDYQGTITRLLANLKGGEAETKQEAIRGLWDAYSQRLAQVAKMRMIERAKRVHDGESVVGSVFLRLWNDARDGAIPNVQNSRDLWKLLVTITQHRSITRSRHESRQKRGGDQSFAVADEEVVSREPTVDFVVDLEDETNHQIQELVDPTLQQVALLTIEGYSTEEIGEKLGLSQRSVQRKLEEIRRHWKKDLDE